MTSNDNESTQVPGLLKLKSENINSTNKNKIDKNQIGFGVQRSSSGQINFSTEKKKSNPPTFGQIKFQTKNSNKNSTSAGSIGLSNKSVQLVDKKVIK
jgi:hypothetical protein